MVCGETDKWLVFVQVRRFHDVTNTHKRQMLVKYTSHVNGALEWCVGFMSEVVKCLVQLQRIRQAMLVLSTLCKQLDTFTNV
jgi:hypothetical protein